MWTPSISLELATRIYDGANVAFFFSLVVGVLATALIIIMGGIKESHWEKARVASTERIAELGKETAGAQLELAKLKAPRQIKGEEFVKALEGKPKAPVEIVFVRDDTDSFHLAMQIAHWLKIANWQVSEPAAIAGPDEPRFATSPSAVQAGGNATGVTIVHRMTSEAEYELERGIAIPGLTPIDTPGKALSTALIGSLGNISTMMNLVTGKVGTLRVVVAPKS
jgi:hypothetical protein